MKIKHSIEFSSVSAERPVSYQVLVRDSLGRVVYIRDFFDIDDAVARLYFDDFLDNHRSNDFFSYEFYRIELLDSRERWTHSTTSIYENRKDNEK